MIVLLYRSIEVIVGDRRCHKTLFGLTGPSDDILKTKLSCVELSKAHSRCLLLGWILLLRCVVRQHY